MFPMSGKTRVRAHMYLWLRRWRRKYCCWKSYLQLTRGSIFRSAPKYVEGDTICAEIGSIISQSCHGSGMSVEYFSHHSNNPRSSHPNCSFLPHGLICMIHNL